MPRYITLVNGITAPQLKDSKTSTSPVVIAKALFSGEGGAPLEGVDFEGAYVTLGEYDLVVRYAADDPQMPTAVSVALSRLLGGTASTLTVVEAETGDQPPTGHAIRLAEDLQASGHDEAVRRAGLV